MMLAVLTGRQSNMTSTLSRHFISKNLERLDETRARKISRGSFMQLLLLREQSAVELL